MSTRKGNRSFSNSYQKIRFGGSTFPGFFYKRNLGAGTRRRTQFTPGGTLISNQPTNLWNKYTPGAGVGGSSVATRRAKMRLATSYHVGGSNVATRRAKMRLATSCTNGQQCGKFYSQLGQNQLRPSIYNNPGSNLSVYPPGPNVYF